MYKDLSDSEMLILNLLWESKRKLSAAEIMEHFQERKWKMTTVSTFLSRMIDKKSDSVRAKRQKISLLSYSDAKGIEKKKGLGFCIEKLFFGKRFHFSFG